MLVLQTTTHVPEALHRLTECYLALGVRRSIFLDAQREEMYALFEK